MKNVTLVGLALFAALAFALGNALARNAPAPAAPAEKRIAAAQMRIQKVPGNFQNYNELAMAYARRARETSDTKFYAQAEEAISRSLQIAPDNLEALKVRAWVLLGKHEFSAALTLARQLNRRWPDDVLIYGFLVDANVELGNYKEAEEAAQWMLDIRPGNIPALTRTAYLRELFGDVEGALELMTPALRNTQPQEVEDRAWLLTQMAHLQLSIGKTEFADQLLAQALQLFPDYHYALGQLSRVRTAQGKFAEAADLKSRRFKSAPHPENLFELAVALERAGRIAEARKAFASFEKSARAEMKNLDNANRELIFYYADHAKKPVEALRVAELEIERRKDCFTLDAHAWALSAAGRHAEAIRQSKAALAVGIRDAKLLYHAGVISSRAGKTALARQYWKETIQANPKSEVAASARRALQRGASTPSARAAM